MSGTVIIGLGNTLRCDDGVGIEVCRCLARLTPEGRYTFVESNRGGLDLLELLNGFDAAHLIDAVVTGREPPGHLWSFSMESLPPALVGPTSHEVDLRTAMELGRRLGYALPQQVRIWGVEVVDPFTFDESLSEPVASAVGPCAELILGHLEPA